MVINDILYKTFPNAILKNQIFQQNQNNLSDVIKQTNKRSQFSNVENLKLEAAKIDCARIPKTFVVNDMIMRCSEAAAY